MASETAPSKRKPQAASRPRRDRSQAAGLLAEDATRTYAELGRLLHLSAPAVHERAKRLKHDGVVKATVATLDGASLGRPLLAFVHVDTSSCRHAPTTATDGVSGRRRDTYGDRRKRDAAESTNPRHADARTSARAHSIDRRLHRHAELHRVDDVSRARAEFAGLSATVVESGLGGPQTTAARSGSRASLEPTILRTC